MAEVMKTGTDHDEGRGRGGTGVFHGSPELSRQIFLPEAGEDVSVKEF